MTKQQKRTRLLVLHCKGIVWGKMLVYFLVDNQMTRFMSRSYVFNKHEATASSWLVQLSTETEGTSCPKLTYFHLLTSYICLYNRHKNQSVKLTHCSFSEPINPVKNNHTQGQFLHTGRHSDEHLNQSYTVNNPPTPNIHCVFIDYNISL